ncbi:MAG: branched-chain amino acid ABC transporter permease [Patescibacteria group bacterium]
MFDIVPQLIANSVIAGSIYALVAMSFSLIYGATKFFNLAHGVLAAIGGYTVFYLGRKLGLPLEVVLPAGIILAAFVGWALEYFLYRPLRARKASSMVLLVASLGAFTAIQAVIAILFTSQFQTLGALIPNSGVVHIGEAVMTEVQVVILALSVAILVGLMLALKFTKFGRAVRAVSDDEEVAKIVGINTSRIVGWVFVVGSAIAGAAGILVGFDTGLEPTMGLALLLKGVIAAIVGGVGSISGAFLGAFLLGFAENFGIWHISGEWKDAIAFGILILFLLFRPQGILGRK